MSSVFQLNEQANCTLLRLKDELGLKSKERVITHAVTMLKLFTDAAKNNEKMFIESADGSRREIVLR